MRKPYEFSGPWFARGDRVGWVGPDGVMHVEVVKDMRPGDRGSVVIECESSDQLGKATAQLDEVMAFVQQIADRGSTP